MNFYLKTLGERFNIKELVFLLPEVPELLPLSQSSDISPQRINWLETKNVDLVEQPLPANKLEDTFWVKERVNLPLIADESVKNSTDVEEAAEAFDGINVKLMKCGGILEAIKMIRLAKRKNLKIMIGCMVESSLGISAAANLLPLVDYADLDSNLLITNDPFKGLKSKNGIVTVPDVPGLGVLPNDGVFS